MLSRFLRSWRCSIPVSACLLSLAGCQSSGDRPASATPPMLGALSAASASGPKAVAPSEPTPKLTASQVADVRVAYARSLEKRGELQQAMAIYQEVLKQDASRSDACGRLATLYDRQGRFQDSIELYRKALKGQPGSADLYCNMGYSLYLQRRWPEAEMNLRQALALEPAHQRARNNLGLVLAHTGRDAAAVAEFRKGGCSEADAHANAAFSLSLEGQVPKARQHYQLALAADPKSEHVRKGMQELETAVARMGMGGSPTTVVAGQTQGVVDAAAQTPASAPAPILPTGAKGKDPVTPR